MLAQEVAKEASLAPCLSCSIVVTGETTCLTGYWTLDTLLLAGEAVIYNLSAIIT